MSNKKTYTEGMEDAVKIWGTVCEGRDCHECAVGVVKGDDITCQEFAKKFPKKFVSLLLDQQKQGISYVNEFNIRFPNNPMSAEDLAEMGICRRAIFEGYLDCPKPSSECVQCWNKLFVEDVDYSEE